YISDEGKTKPYSLQWETIFLKRSSCCAMLSYSVILVEFASFYHAKIVFFIRIWRRKQIRRLSVKKPADKWMWSKKLRTLSVSFEKHGA
ncbi:hypothetical protein, partial [Porphyromonas loveana]|uniref:hypothetical protein n=1 Tax=Porphyromonas loveana TaxID=1884669 RepID=UPI0035A11BC7